MQVDVITNADGKECILKLNTAHLVAMNIKLNKNNEYYIHVGKRRIYIGDAVLTDRNNMTVKDYLLSGSNKYKVSITFEIEKMAPDKDFAKLLAMFCNLSDVDPVNIEVEEQ